MRKRSERLALVLYPALTLALVALAIFLPAKLSQWNDRLLLDEPHVLRQDAEREGFAESMQLSIGEKLLMTRSGSASVLRLEEDEVSVSFGIVDGSATVYKGQENYYTYITGVEATLPADSGDYNAGAEAEKWHGRLVQIQDELRTLYQLGAMPQLWSSADTVGISSGGQVLYMDSGQRCLGFQVYYATLSRDPYSMDVAVDVQSGRILAFTISWPVGAEVDLTWGLRGMSNFGEGWRDYWGLDSVDSNWRNNRILGILDKQEATLISDGSYNANADMAFSYDGQTIYIPISSTAAWGRTCQIQWNSRSFG